METTIKSIKVAVNTVMNRHIKSHNKLFQIQMMVIEHHKYMYFLHEKMLLS